jgi:hypothetical protein
MFELQRLAGSGGRSIPLATRLGRAIENEIAPEPTSQHLARYAALLKKHAIGWLPRKQACGGYNCFGHVWASRRTAIYEVSAVRRILADDGYRRTQNPKIDDLALVVQSEEIYHVGRVVELRSVSPGGMVVPWVISKWDDWGGEVLHNVRDLPYDKAQGFDVEVEYWTDRPLAAA